MRRFLFLFTLLVSFSLIAKEVRLFEADGREVSNYRELLLSLQPGDVLFFANDRYKFEFQELIDEGGLTSVLKVKQLAPKDPSGRDGALRVPLDVGKVDYERVRSEGTYRSFFAEYLKGRRPMQASGIRIPKLYSSYKQQFALTELIDIEFDLATFLKNDPPVDSETATKAEEALYRFARSIADFHKISDFHTGQLVYQAQSDEWILLDFANNHKKIFPFFTRRDLWENAFQWIMPPGGEGISPELDQRNRRMLKHITHVIQEQRQSRGKIFLREVRACLRALSPG